MYGGRGFSLAFASKDDARRFQVFIGECERECGLPVEWTRVYVLDPGWKFREHDVVPSEATCEIDQKVVLQMLN